MGAVERAGGEGQGGPRRPARILMAAPSPSPPAHPVVQWSAPGWGSIRSSGRAGASGCSAFAGCRLWMGGARRAHTGRSWRAGRSPGGRQAWLSAWTSVPFGASSVYPPLSHTQPRPLRLPSASPGPSRLLQAEAGGAAHTSVLCTDLASRSPSAASGSLAEAGPPQGWAPGPTVWGAPVSLQGEGLSDTSSASSSRALFWLPLSSCLWFHFFSGSPFVGPLYLPISLCVSSSLCCPVSAGLSLSMSLFLSLFPLLALVVPSVWSTYLPNIQCLAPSFPPRIFSNVVFSVRPSLTSFSPAVPTPSPASFPHHTYHYLTCYYSLPTRM